MVQFAQKTHSWNGITVVLSNIQTQTGLFLATGSATHAKIAIALESEGGRCETRLRWDRGGRARPSPNTVHYVPSRVPTWCVSKEVRALRHVALMIDPRAVPERSRVDFESWAGEPRLGLSSPNLFTLGRLIADEVDSADRSDALYGDSLVLAMFVQLKRSIGHVSEESTPRQLTPRQLALVIEYMVANLSSGVELQTLAELTDLSQSTFCEAFKRTTGLPPYRYYLNLRIQRAQELLGADTKLSLASLAAALGFADQSHFARVFRKAVGVSPSAWRSQRR